MVVRPPANLKATGVETGYFAELPGVVPGLAVADPVQTVDETLEAFSAGETQLFHLACHGNFDLTDPNESKLKLADGFLTPSQLTGDRKSGLLRARPLVFVNACHAGERGFGLTRLGGWAERFIAAGASAFIGSLWAINDDLAARFAVTHHALQQIPRGLLELAAVAVQVADPPADARRIGLIGGRQLDQGPPPAEVQAGQKLAKVLRERVHPTTTNRHWPRAARVWCWCL
jgi:hypothetical protein